MPKVSVILTSYNHEKYVAESIQSVLNQTFTDFELLIFDDGSQDRSQEVIRSFHDERIRLFLFSANRGPMACLRELVQEAEGEYIAIHHSDDVWALNRLEKQVGFLEQHLEYAACFSRVRFIDEAGLPYDLPEGHAYRSVFEQENRSRALWLRRFFFEGNCLCHPSLLIRREMYASYELLSEKGLWQSPDYLMWIKLCMHEDIYVMPDCLVFFRLHRQGQETNTSAEKPDGILRSNFELFEVVQTYQAMDAALFAEAFPEFARYLLEGDISFGLGQVCIASAIPAYRLFGMSLLFRILNGPAAQLLQERFFFDDLAFARLCGDVDCFNLRRDMCFAHMSVLLDRGAGYQEQNRQSQLVYVHANGEFQVDFEIADGAGVQRVRFDPDEDRITGVRICRVLQDGVEASLQWLGERRSFHDMEFAWNCDPMYELVLENQGKPLQRLSVFGKLHVFSEDESAAVVRDMDQLLLEERRRQDRLKDRCGEIKAVLTNTQQVLADTRQVLTDTQDALAAAREELDQFHGSLRVNVRNTYKLLKERCRKRIEGYFNS